MEGGCPWLFDTSIFVIEAYNGKTKSKELSFHKASFFMQLHNMSLGGMNRRVGMKVGNSVDLVETVDADEEDIGWGKQLRVRVQIDLTLPIAQGRTVNIDGEKCWIPFQYEKLPNFVSLVVVLFTILKYA